MSPNPGWARLRRTLLVLAAATATLAAPATALAAPPANIVGGEEASTADRPWLVALVSAKYYPNRANVSHQFCGGTLVTPTKIVTAAHCVSGLQAKYVQVVAGRTDLRTQAGDVRQVSAIAVHASYRSVEKGDDVAVLTLSQALNRRTLPVVASTDTNLYAAGTTAAIMGWGDTYAGQGDGSPTLLAATVPVTSNADCTDAYGRRYLKAKMVCAGYPEGGVDTCQGDSGGPFVINGKLAGVVSWGDGCADPGVPGIYTRLTSYSGWISNNL
ncbi:serine protease [Longispora sp. NPDC051575]|uniref:S1 family peptidase n=1 Tax=Longispora sp. NPDC051575 TaxID=3154943 RepID=UPI0034483671